MASQEKALIVQLVADNGLRSHPVRVQISLRAQAKRAFLSFLETYRFGGLANRLVCLADYTAPMWSSTRLERTTDRVPLVEPSLVMGSR